MNRTKTIYFLSAFVLIIGCYALNLSYSLFTQTIAPENNLVESTIPTMEVSLSMESVEIEAGQEYLIKQTVINNSDTPVSFGINATSTSENFTLQVADNGYGTNLSHGVVEARISETETSTKDVYFVVKNNNTESITINFTVNYNYASLSYNKEDITNISDEGVDVSAVGMPYIDNPNTLGSKILSNFVLSDLYAGSSTNGVVTDFDNLFTNDTNKISLPVATNSSAELDVPSPTEFTGVEENEVGLYKAVDDYGTSYYFRGASSTNYVKFAGFVWRIVRINGNGSVRLILDETSYRAKKEGTTNYIHENERLLDLTDTGLVDFNKYGGANAYIGYMYGDGNSTSYDAEHSNINDSFIKKYTDIFYEEYILDYQTYLADTMFCGDKSLASKTIDGSNTAKGYGTNKTYYAAAERLYYRQDSLKIRTATPTLECAKGDTNTYSRYTSTIDMSTETSKGVLVNNDLKYPIAHLSADELVMAGAWGGYGATHNDEFYLQNYESWWTMTPVLASFAASANIFVYDSSALFYTVVDNTNYYIKPVINLRSDLLVDTGNGTSDYPYTVKLPE